MDTENKKTERCTFCLSNEKLMLELERKNHELQNAVLSMNYDIRVAPINKPRPEPLLHSITVNVPLRINMLFKDEGVQRHLITTYFHDKKSCSIDYWRDAAVHFDS